MTDLDTLAIGSTCASTTVTTDGSSALFGMCCEIGLHEDTGEPYVVLLNEVPSREVRVAVYHQGASKPKTPGVARLRRVDLADIDPASIEEPNVSRMQGWAKKALLGEVVLPGETFALAVIAGMLFQEARNLSNRQHEQWEAERAEREGLAS